MTCPYFARPEQFVAFLEAEAPCDGCGQTKRCLDAAVFYGEETLAAICPDCLTGGQLKDRDVFTCTGDTEELGRQLRALHPAWSPAEVEKAVAEKTETLEKTTPPVISWQDWSWPCADGDYCTFVGFGSKAWYNRLSPDGDGASVFQLSLYYTVLDDADADELWDSMPAREITDLAASQAHDLLFYVFESRVTGRPVTVWDTL